jgi:hypothetical protein
MRMRMRRTELRIENENENENMKNEGPRINQSVREAEGQDK